MSHHIARNISDGLKLGLTAGTALEGDTRTINNAEITKLGHISVSGSINLDDEKAQIATNATNIASNTGSIFAHTTAINNKLAGTTSSGLKTLIDVNTAKNSYPSADATKVGYLTITGGADIDAMKALGNTNSSAISTLTTDTNNKFGMTSSSAMKTAIDLNTAKTGLSASNEAKLDNLTISSATDLDAIRNELDSIVLTTTQISNDRIIMGSAPSFGTGCGIQNPQFDATMVNTKVMIRQDNAGKTIVNTATGKTISFRVNNVEQFDSDDVKALTDNISITQAVDLDDIETKVALNNSLIYVNLNSINNIALPPLKIHALAHRVSHIGSTARSGASDLVAMTTSAQPIRWEDVVSSTHGGGIVWTTLGGASNTYFKIPETALYRVSATIVLMFGSTGNERQATLHFDHYNNSSGAITSIRQAHCAMNRQDGNNFSFNTLHMDTPVLLEEDEYYFFQCKSLNQGNIVIHSSNSSANSVIITKIQTDNAGNTFGSAGGFDLDGNRTFVGV